MYVLVTIARNGLALVIYAPRGGTPGIFCDQIVRYVNSDFFTVKNWVPVSLSLKMLVRARGIEKYVYSETQSRHFAS